MIALPGRPSTPRAIAEVVLCSNMGNWGAGLTTADSPMLTSATLLIEPGMKGGGAMTPAWDAAVALDCRREIPASSGTGATAEAWSRPRWRAIAWLEVVWLESGGGATTHVGAAGVRREWPVAESGIMGAGACHAGSCSRPAFDEIADAIISGGRISAELCPGLSPSLRPCSGDTRIVGRCAGPDCRLGCVRSRGE